MRQKLTAIILIMLLVAALAPCVSWASDYEQPAQPTFSPDGGSFDAPVDVTISCSTPGAIIHYTINGNDPTESDPIIASGGKITVSSEAQFIAVAWNGDLASNASYAYFGIQVAPPTFTPGECKIYAETDVVVECSTPGAVLHYTVDGSWPTKDSPIIASGSTVHLSETTRLNVLGFKDGLTECGTSALYRLMLNPLAVPQAEYDALVALYNSTGGPGWDCSGGWLTEDESWYGVTVEDGHITAINLKGNRLSGTIPPELGNLSKLRELNLSCNILPPPSVGLSGVIPPELSNAKALTRLDLSYNALTGSIPAELGSMPKLAELNLCGNSLSGTIAPELANAKELVVLDLSDNRFTGNIPACLASLPCLHELNLDWNQLTGTIPAEFGSTPALTRLSLCGNQLTGIIPPELGNAANLGELNLADNHLTGEIPPQLGNTHLAYLWLSYNSLAGVIPQELSRLHLRNLGLDNNNLTGEIPNWLGSMHYLRTLGLSNNKFTGPIPSELADLTMLDSLDLSGNQLSGEVPMLPKITGFGPYFLSIGYNALTVSDPDVREMLIQGDDWGGEWKRQTIAPSNVSVAGVGSDYVALAWDPISYQADGGYYEVGVSTTPGGPYIFNPANRTSSKSATGLKITGLAPGTTYHFAVKSFTPAHERNKSDLTSSPSGDKSDSTLSGQPQAFDKSLPNGAYVVIDGAYVSACTTDDFYIEHSSRAFGVLVEKPAHELTNGPAQVIGTLKTNDNCERYVEAERTYQFTPATDYTPTKPLRPLFMPNKSLGGADWHYNPETHAGQRGFENAAGLNNIGLLVKTSGKITQRGQVSLPDVAPWIKISDGSGVEVKCILPIWGYIDPAWTKVVVTGISSCEFDGSKLTRVIRVHNGSDIAPY